MKKKLVKKTVRTISRKKAASQTKKASRRKPLETSFSYQRIFIYASCVALFAVIFTLFNKQQVTQAVAGVSITRGLFNQATVALPPVQGAVSYNIYFKSSSEKTYNNAARNIPATFTSYTISYLQKGKLYTYKISALDGSGREFWWSSVKWLTGITSM